MINVAICENNAMQIKYVVDVIKKYSIKENMDFMIDKFISGEELLNSNHSKYNVIFLEIKMNGISGIDTAKKIRETNEEVKIIFLTSSKELWAEAFKVNAFRYLVKPVKEKELYNEISTVVNEIKRNNKYIILNYHKTGELAMANLGELLAELRHDRGLKQEELADILHLSKSTISSYERGQQLPPLDKLVCLADFFHVTTDYLLGRCDVSVSPDSLNAELLPHKTAASVIRDIGNLSSEQKRALAVIINDMKKLSTILGEVQ